MVRLSHAWKSILLALTLFDAPLPSMADPDPSPVRVNQVGYLKDTSKIGVIVSSSTSPISWSVQDAATGVAIASGTTTVYGDDPASGDNVHQADFSSLTDIGSYRLVVNGVGESVVFAVSPSLYTNLPHEAMNYFYFHRMGIDIKKEHLVDDRYDRGAIHPGDNNIPPYSGWCSECDDFDIRGSWADAGDFGVYTVNHAISAWTLLNLNEQFPDAFTDGSLNIPESGNSIPDVLDEVDYGSRFLRGMLPSDGGLASHKAHNHAWSAFTITVEGENQMVRSAMGPSTAATYAVARVNAQLARMWEAQPGGASHAAVLWNAAKDAWNRADGTNHIYDAQEASPGPAMGGGDYPDDNIDDDRYCAAAEMYLTAFANNDADMATYKAAMQSNSHYKQMRLWDWGTVDGAGTLSLYAVANDLSATDKSDIASNIVAFADDIKAAFGTEGYPANFDFPNDYDKYPWGSNSFMMNRAIILAYAYEITGDSSYQDYIMRTMDYMMGVNAMRISYVTGYGEFTETDTHDRWAWTIGEDSFWPKGWLSGGPNNELINDYETPSTYAAKSYAAPGTAPHAWGSKENTVNWNAPLAWVSWYIENRIVNNLGGCGGNCPPQASSKTFDVQMDTPLAITLDADDFDGNIASWVIVENPSMGYISGSLPQITYTPNSQMIGIDSFTFRVTDEGGAVSKIAKITLEVKNCDFSSYFQVPRSSSYPATTATYEYVHVSEDGPNLGAVTKHTIQYPGSDLYEFSLSLSGSPYYADLRGCMSERFSETEPSFSFSNCAVSGIDGEYWINQIDGNEIWVEKNNQWAIVFSNSDVPPEFCQSGTSAPVSPTVPTTSPPVSDPTDFPTQSLVPTNAGLNPTNSPVSNPTNSPTQSLVPTKSSPSPTKPPGKCRSSCYDSTKPWKNLCKKKKCANCPECNEQPTDPPSSFPTNAPIDQPTNNDYCCTFDKFHCGIDSSCNGGIDKCQVDCGGTWLSRLSPSMQCISKRGECTRNESDCCDALSCVGSENYKQCI